MIGKTVEQAPPKATTRRVLALPGHGVWYAAAALVRAPVVMAPLALVFLGHSGHSFAVGGTLAAAHALGQGAAAPATGHLFDTRSFVCWFRLMLCVEAAAFATLALLPADLPIALPLALAFAAGAAASGAPGGMRAELSAATPEPLRPKALALENAVSQAVWAFAPPLASVLYVRFSVSGLFAVLAVLSFTPALLARHMPHDGGGRKTQAPARAGARTAEVLRLVWPTALLSAAMMFLIGTADILLPARLAETGVSPAYAGPVMTVFAVASVVSGLVYCAGRWPGGPRLQSAVLVLGLSAAFVIPALTDDVRGLVLAFAVGGVLYSPLSAIRNLALQQRLPAWGWATGFCLLSAAAGIGYGVAGLTSALLLHVAGTGPAFLLCAGVTAGTGLLALAGEGRRSAVRTPA